MQLITANKEIQEIWFEALLAESDQTLLFFYSKDNTPGCTREAREFSVNQPVFAKAGIQIIGVSKDSGKAHCNFINKQALELRLIADEDLSLHELFGTWGEKKNYGKVYEGAIRSTFLLNKDWTIIKEWRNVKATGHVERVMRELGLETMK